MATPPTVPQRPFQIRRHEDVRDDPYYWLMDRDDETVLAHLRAENDYLRESFEGLKSLEDELFEEIKARIEETDISVPVRKGDWWYFERTRGGTQLSVELSSTRSARGGPDAAGDRSLGHARR